MKSLVILPSMGLSRCAGKKRSSASLVKRGGYPLVGAMAGAEQAPSRKAWLRPNPPYVPARGQASVS
jgi:hypothetical protein